MGIEKAGFHLAGAFFRNIGKVIFSFFIFLIIGFVVMEAVAYFIATPHEFKLAGHVVAVLFGLAVGYAAALTVIAREAIHALVAAVRSVEGDVQGELSGAGKVLQAVEQAITKGR